MKKFFYWLFDRAAGTYLSLALLVVIGGIVSVSAAGSWNVSNAPQMYLYSSITATQTSNIVIEAPQINGDNWTFPTTTGGVLRIRSGTYREDIHYGSASVNATTYRVTLSGVTRDLCPSFETTFISCGNGRRWGKGAIVELIQDARLFNLKLNSDRVNTTGTGFALRTTSVTLPIVRFNNVTTAERTAMSAGNGDVVYDSTLGALYQYVSGAWAQVGDTGTVNASETAAGKVELATVAEQIAASATGSTAAALVVQAKNLTRTGSGTSYAGKVPLLGNDGTLTGSLLSTNSASASMGYFLQFGNTFAIPTTSYYLGSCTDGDVEVGTGTTVTLTGDANYNNLTIYSGATLNPAGYRVYVCNTLTLKNAQTDGKIASNGGNGGDGGDGKSGDSSGGSAGTAGTAAHSAGTLPASLAGDAGGAGGSGRACAGADRVGAAGGSPGAATSEAVGLGSAASNGGASGAGADGGTGAAGGAAGSAGTAGSTAITTAKVMFNSMISILSWPTARDFSGSGAPGAGAGAGGGGADDTCIADGKSGGGGGGGGSGANGGNFDIYVGTLTGSGYIQANGGNGGAGGDSGACVAGGYVGDGAGSGGGGGSGGMGGTIMLFYKAKTAWTGTIEVSGGNAGAGGLETTTNCNASSESKNGTAGSDGNAGVLFQFQVR